MVPPDASFTTEFRPELLGGVTVLQGQVHVCTAEPGKAPMEKADLTAVPFYAAANREACAMQVWLPARSDNATPVTLATAL